MSDTAHNDVHHHHDIPHFHTKDLIIREDIMAKAKNLAELITTSHEVQLFKKAEALLENHQEVQSLIQQIKKKQKEAVAFETFENPQMVAKIEAEIDELQNKLDEYPLVNQFKQAQDDINYLLQLVISVIRDTVAEKINMDRDAVDAQISNCSD